MKKRFLSSLVVSCVLSLVFLSNSSLCAAPPDCPSCNSFGVQRPSTVKGAPPFTLKGLDGVSTSLASLKGRPVLLFFWGTWCDSCKEDMPLFEKFAEGKKDQISFITVAVDGEREKKVRQIVTKMKMKLPVLLILKEDVIDTYEIRMIPMVAMINQDGALMGKAIGQRDWLKPEAWSAVKELFNLH